MYLASFEYRGRDCVGVRNSAATLLILNEFVREHEGIQAAAPTDLLAIVAGTPALLPAIAALLTLPVLPDSVTQCPLDQVRWHPPVRQPGKIVGVAMNNSASDARKISAPSHPMFFLKPRTSLLGHLNDLELRSYYGSVHPEPELAVVIGRRARDIDPQEALDVVFGYSIMNDMTGNAMRAEDMVHYYALYASPEDSTRVERREQHLSYAARYKGTDGFGPMGPWLVTRDEIANPGRLRVTCRVGEDVIAEDSTEFLTYSVQEIIAFLSRFQTLEPGDILSMGTAFRPQPGARRSLHAADLQRVDGPVIVEIEGLGSLCTPVRRVSATLEGWKLPPR